MINPGLLNSECVIIVVAEKSVSGVLTETVRFVLAVVEQFARFCRPVRNELQDSLLSTPVLAVPFSLHFQLHGWAPSWFLTTGEVHSVAQ
jgi:hypothetical protein